MSRIGRWVGAVWCGFCCFLVTPLRAEQSADTLRVITYNVQFLPEPVSAKNERPEPRYRARRIAEEASQFDVVGLQETFHDTYREQITRQLRERWGGSLQQVESPTPKGFFTSGGCLLLSRMTIVDQGAVTFRNFSKPEDHGLRADGYAAKGVIHGRLARDRQQKPCIDVFVTHLEARDDDLRPLQYGELAAFIKERSNPANPAIFLGDLNTRGAANFRRDPRSQYSKLVEQLRSSRNDCELIDVWAKLKPDALGGTTKQESHEVGKRIDYIFVLNPKGQGSRLHPVSVDVRLFQDPKVVALSDHNAVVAEFEWLNR